MRIIALGDTHGRVNWKEIVEKEKNADKIIFIGDYFDTHGGVSANKQIVNFNEIIDFKRTNPDKVIILIGNHDFHYIRGVGENYSGYQSGYAIDIGEAIHKALDENLMQMCFVHGKFVFTHAGITKTWAEANEVDVQHLEESVNDLFKYTPNVFKFTMGDNFSNTGNDVTQTPIWVRPGALYNNMIEDVVTNYTCVVGHTIVKELDINSKFPNLIMIDCLGTSGEYLVIEDGVAKSSK